MWTDCVCGLIARIAEIGSGRWRGCALAGRSVAPRPSDQDDALSAVLDLVRGSIHDRHDEIQYRVESRAGLRAPPLCVGEIYLAWLRPSPRESRRPPVRCSPCRPCTKRKKEIKQTTQGRDGRTAERKKENRQPKGGVGGRHAATTQGFQGEKCCGLETSTWSTWSAVINRTSRAEELRSAPSGPDDWHRVTG